MPKRQPQPQPLTYAQLSAIWAERCQTFVTETHRAMMRDQSFRPWYCYVRPSRGPIWGELWAGPEGVDAPDGYELATPVRIPPRDRAGIAAWLETFAGRLPVLPTDR